jgi:alpha-galactosidase
LNHIDLSQENWSILLSDAGFRTCAGLPASLGYETKDANTYASWGVDYLKYDNCNNDHSAPEIRYGRMRDALNHTGRPIFFSMCGKLMLNEAAT